MNGCLEWTEMIGNVLSSGKATPVCVCNSYHTYVYDVQAGTLIHCVPNVICAIASVNAFLRCSALLQFWHCYLHMFWIVWGDVNAS